MCSIKEKSINKEKNLLNKHENPLVLNYFYEHNLEENKNKIKIDVNNDAIACDYNTHYMHIYKYNKENPKEHDEIKSKIIKENFNRLRLR